MGNEAYLSLFKEESAEHLQMMNQNLLALEKDPTNLDVINEIFRNAHTLKGMAASMNFQKITELSHEMENLMDCLRSGQIAVTPEIFDTLFGCFDALELLVEEAVTGEAKDVEIGSLVANLQSFTAGAEEAASTDDIETTAVDKEAAAVVVFDESELEIAAEALGKGYFLYKIKITLDEGCLLKAARAYMVFRNLEETGKLVKSVPSRIDIEEEKFEFEFEVYQASDEKREELQEMLGNISEIESVEVDSLSLADLGKAPKVVVASKLVIAPSEKDLAGRKKSQEEKTQIVHTVRVDIKRLDNLMNLVGELVISRTQLVQVAETQMKKEMSSTLAQVGRVVADLQDLVMKVRMVPIEQVFNRFPRMVRDLTKAMDKKINLEISGEETEIDRTVVDEIGDPLVHILRNSVDHGIEIPSIRKKQGKPEIGTVKLSASHEGDRILIRVEDDGAGIDSDLIARKALEKGLIGEAEFGRMNETEKLNLIFLPGLSTAEKVSDVSGRGVGMDVVRTKILSLRGFVEIESRQGLGSTIIIKLPLTLAIIEALMISLADETYAIPLGVISETVTIGVDEISMVKNREVILLRGEVLPLVKLRDMYDIISEEETATTEDGRINVVVVYQGNKRFGLVVDSLIGQQEIVIKSLGTLLVNIKGIAGATILGDGKVALIIDITALQ